MSTTKNLFNSNIVNMLNPIDEIILSPLPGEVQKQIPEENIQGKWSLTWEENIFAKTQNISEPRGPKYLCTECGDVFNTRLSFITHSKIHFKPFCLICGTYADTIFQMELHMLSEHPSFIRFKQESSPEKNTELNQKKEIFVADNLPEVYEQVPGISPRKSGKQGAKPKRNSNKCANKNSSSKIKRLEQITKMVTSRFGRCITVKMPCY